MVSDDTRSLVGDVREVIEELGELLDDLVEALENVLASTTAVRNDDQAIKERALTSAVLTPLERSESGLPLERKVPTTTL